MRGVVQLECSGTRPGQTDGGVMEVWRMPPHLSLEHSLQLSRRPRALNIEKHSGRRVAPSRACESVVTERD